MRYSAWASVSLAGSCTVRVHAKFAGSSNGRIAVSETVHLGSNPSPAAVKKILVIIDGPMGSGKTTIGKILRQNLKRTAVLSTDMIKFFLSDFERGERDNAITAAVLMQMCKEYINQGISIVLAQGFWKEEYLRPYLQLAKENNLEVFIYQLEAPKDFLIERIRNRPTPELAKTPVPEERIQKNLQKWEENRYNLGKTFDVTKMSSEQIAKEILNDITKSFL